MPHIKLRVSSQSGHPDLLYTQEWVNVIFLHLWPQKLYRAFRFGTLWPISCSYPRHSQLTRHSLMLATGGIRQSLTALVCLFAAIRFFILSIYSKYYLYYLTTQCIPHLWGAAVVVWHSHMWLMVYKWNWVWLTCQSVLLGHDALSWHMFTLCSDMGSVIHVR